MGNSESKQPEKQSETSFAVVEATVVPPAEKPKCKACCACPETKRVRDAW